MTVNETNKKRQRRGLAMTLFLALLVATASLFSDGLLRDVHAGALSITLTPTNTAAPPTETPPPTATAIATETALPTNTPAPTETAAPTETVAPTETPAVTGTAAATSTPVSEGDSPPPATATPTPSATPAGPQTIPTLGASPDAAQIAVPGLLLLAAIGFLAVAWLKVWEALERRG